MFNAGAASGLGHGLGCALRRQARRPRPIGDRHSWRRFVYVRQSDFGALCRRRAGFAGIDRTVQQPALAGGAPRHGRMTQATATLPRVKSSRSHSWIASRITKKRWRSPTVTAKKLPRQRSDTGARARPQGGQRRKTPGGDQHHLFGLGDRRPIPYSFNFTRLHHSGSVEASQLLVSGVFDRVPKLQIYQAVAAFIGSPKLTLCRKNLRMVRY